MAITTAHRAALIIVCWVLQSSLVAVGSAQKTNDETDPKKEAKNDDGSRCGLYMAPSSTSLSAEEPVWGLFAGKDIAADENIGNNELAVNLFQLKAHTGFDEESEDESQQYINEIVAALEGYLWVPEPAGAKFEMLEGNTITWIPGPGIVSAMNAKLTNAQWHHYSAYHRQMVGELPGVPYAGRGAVTPFYNVAVKSTEPIKRGAEIFLSYGINYEEHEENDDLQKEDYEKLDQTIEKMVAFFDKYETELDDKAKSQIYSFLSKDVMNAAVGPERQRAVSKILPTNPNELKSIIEAGGSIKYDKSSVFRDVDWLEKQGFCADNIKFGASTIEGAGRGAFATRAMKAGSTIVASPLLPIADGSIFDMHPLEHDEEEEEFVKASDEVTGIQLLVNYCFGSPFTSMLFLPVGPGVAFVNHSKKPNAKLAWSKKNREDWFDLSPEDMLEQDYMGLLIEVVALRDIEASEEIFLDYGDAWDSAFTAFKDKWEKEKRNVVWPTKAIDLSEKYRTQPYPTSRESAKPYPDNIGLMAFTMIKESTAAGTLAEPKEWDVPGTGTVYDAANLFEVSIVDRQEVDSGIFNYTIRWLNVKQEATYVVGVPHSAIVLVDMPHTSDHFVESPFRHPIQIPDDIFPTKGPWHNIGVGGTEDE